ncbi:MAG: hypothetical protein Q8R07_05615 [Candidatus Uhrbacteria bacterium]|nr:hypothetical protein [Candidatus Uhrbacteria bacterium]
MTRTFALTMRRPHETLHLPMPVGRKLSEAGKTAWSLLILGATLGCFGVYIFQVNAAASRGFHLRVLEKRLEALQEHVSMLENQAAQAQTLRSLEGKVKALGYVPVDHMEFLNAPTGYAVAK